MPFDATARPLWLNLLAFALSAAVVWLAGTRLSRYAELITERTHAGGVLVGTLLLGVVASLPEAVVSVTAAAMGNARLAVNTLLGGVVFSLLIVAVTDGLIGKEALSSDIRHPVVPLQGVLAILMLVCAAAGIGAGDVGALGVGAWTSGLLLLYVLTVSLVKHVQRSLPWVVGREGHPPPAEAAAPVSAGSRRSLRSVVLCTVLAALAILVAGFVAAVTADALSEQTGLGPSFAGFVLGGVATSLPEASSTYAAVRLKRYEMAFSDAFGTNLCSVMLLFFCDACFDGGPVLNEVGRFSLFATLLGAAVTAVYVAGLIGRPQKVLLRMGLDSVLVLILSVGGLVLLYRLR